MTSAFVQFSLTGVLLCVEGFCATYLALRKGNLVQGVFLSVFGSSSISFSCIQPVSQSLEETIENLTSIFVAILRSFPERCLQEAFGTDNLSSCKTIWVAAQCTTIHSLALLWLACGDIWPFCSAVAIRVTADMSCHFTPWCSHKSSKIPAGWLIGWKMCTLFKPELNNWKFH